MQLFILPRERKWKRIKRHTVKSSCFSEPYLPVRKEKTSISKLGMEENFF